MITYQLENFNDCIDEAIPMFEDHIKEIDLFGDPLNIDIEAYRYCQEVGAMKVYTMREDNKLVGYCAFDLFNHAHHQVLHAKQDVLFILKEHRGRGIQFIKFCDRKLQQAGVKVVHQCVPAKNDWSLLLKRIGYSKLEEIYIRRL